MRRRLQTPLIVLMSALALFTSLASLRYLAPSHPYLMEFQVLALLRHRIWFPMHIACGVVTLLFGLLQFSQRLRSSRPALHRMTGYVYVAAVLLGGVAGLRLSPDTPTLLAQGLTEDAHSTVVYGLHTSEWGFPPGSTYTPSQFTPITYSFALLAVTWLFVTAMALRYAIRRDFGCHRAWMIRSYSLTFAAVTVRLAAGIAVLVFREPALASNLALTSWTLNLVVAEWLIRRSQPKPVVRAAHA